MICSFLSVYRVPLFLRLWSFIGFCFSLCLWFWFWFWFWFSLSGLPIEVDCIV